MLEDIKSKEYERISNVIADLEEQKEGIEEKYRNIIESETAALTSAIEAYKEMLNFWDTVDGSVTVKPKRKRRTKAEMEAARLAETELPDDEKVVDEQDEDYISQKEIDNRKIQELPEPVPFEEPIDNEVTPEPIEVSDFSEQVEDNEITEEAKANEDDVWPEFPAEWK